MPLKYHKSIDLSIGGRKRTTYIQRRKINKEEQKLNKEKWGEISPFFLDLGP
jgi:hypothetical protein